MITYTRSIVASILNGKLIVSPGTSDPVIRYLSFDSRTILYGKETLFFALKSGNNDGHRFIQDALEKEVGCFVVERIPDALDKKEDVSFILVENTLLALQQLAASHRRHFSYPVVAITGSNGKTMVKEWLAELLGRTLRVVRSPRSYNSQIGCPLSVWLMHDHCDLALIEAGISKRGEMERLESILHPDHGIFTHLGSAHLENFRSVEELVTEKVKLFKSCKLIVYCRDFEWVHLEMMRLAYTEPPRFFTWSAEGEANLRIRSVVTSGQTSQLLADFEGQRIALTIPFTDAAHVENAIHCWAYLLATGSKPGSFESHFLHLSPVAMRLEIKKGIHGCAIIDDSYNSDLASLANALDYLCHQNIARNLKSTLILSDILQTGKDPARLYQEVAAIIQAAHIERLVGIGPEISRFADLFEVPEQRFYLDTEAFVLHFRESDFGNELILLKGARNYRFDRISSLLQEKKHQTVMEIDLSAMVHNLRHYKSMLNPSTRMMIMVKAFSYGTGSVEIAKMLQYHRADYLAVAIADEGVELRNAGIDLPIVVMNPEEHSFSTMIENRLEPNVYKFSLLYRLEEELRKNAVENFPIHIKLDTGMKRLGFDQEEEVKKLIQIIQRSNRFFVRSVFTHLAVSEDPAGDAFTKAQFSRFQALSGLITEAFDYRILRHILNSAGIERFPEMQLDMVRLGIGLYGVSSSPDTPLKNVATLKSVISQIKWVHPGESVGYGRKFISDGLRRIAVIPIGYADGYSRRLGNGVGSVWIKGQLAPVTGTICMDMCMVDVTEIPCEENDLVILFGEALPVTQLARWAGTIPYEILTTVGPRVKRIYFEE
ncbi:MAG: bifunctional UDP-N-acetylmuramoyl-tripeptide:D-alanyl-D-alanine ligase/alanine racemase [Marinilabiliales bacterium]|nr:bifunctional UDP-N-acetylmuramoyl-tripeptide:D-alanyl-D-alanine ligase/alanine racemase [Marinilabiliales bacterium]